MAFEFDYIISPYSTEEFFLNYFEKAPLAIKRNSSRYYSDILTLDDINVHLNEADIIYPNIRIVKNGDQVDEADFTYSSVAYKNNATEGIANKDKVFFYFQNGYTIILNALERHKIKLLNLRHVTEKAFNTKAQINIYLTPVNSQGFTPHWDTHDVFILQIGGSKAWKIYESPVYLPSRKQIFKNDWEKTEPILSVILEEGDLIYVPRGFIHEATATDQYSLHITLGVITNSYGNFLRVALEEIEDDPFFRRSMPAEINEEDLSSFRAYIHKYISEIDLEKVRSTVQSRFVSSRLPDVTDRLKDYFKIGSVTEKTVFSKRKSLYYDFHVNVSRVKLRFSNKSMKFPLFTLDDIKFILAAEEFQISDMNGRLHSDSKILLCKKLLEEGFLTVIDN